MTANIDSDVVIAGAGIAGLTTALVLHQSGISSRIVENAPEFRPLGVGLNVLPHASQVLGRLGLAAELASRAVITTAAAFYNRFGQLIYRDPAGARAGYEDAQYSIHRGDLHQVLVDAVLQRLGPDAITMGSRVTGFQQEPDRAIATFETADGSTGELAGAVLVGADGVHSAIRRQLYPLEGPLSYSGVMMWRGTIPWPTVLDGATMIRAGWLTTGKMVIYPIRKPDADGLQLLNWAAEVEMPQLHGNDWNLPGDRRDFADRFADWHFDWLDVPTLIDATEPVLEYPMVYREPLPRWTHGRVTILGDAAHPMVPRGSNGAGQAILDASALAGHLSGKADWPSALQDFDNERRPFTTNVVLTNLRNPPDAILREVFERTADRPFENIDSVISRHELAAIQEKYRKVAGFTVDMLSARND